MDVVIIGYKFIMGYIEVKLYNMFEIIYCKNKINYF